jgi:N-acetylmuramoyl-L-alanine amidase
VVVIDPGHNGANGSHPSIINQPVWILNGWLTCDTTGTQTNAGYTESSFNLDVAIRTAAILRGLGATVILTRYNNSGVGPCINIRAAIGNRAHANAAISIHADGGPSTGLGFQVILPGNIGPNHAIIAPSDRLGAAVHSEFHAITGEPFATYLGGGSGYTVRTNLGGLNLSTVPKVFIECANMRNATDAARVTSPAWRQRAASGIAAGLEAFLLGH